MLLPQLFRSFVPLRNPIGFGAADFIELAFTLLLVLPALAWRPWIEHYARQTRATDGLVHAGARGSCRSCCDCCFCRSIRSPPRTSATNSATCFACRHVAALPSGESAASAAPVFRDVLDVLQEPSYSSIYPIGQGAGAGHRLDDLRSSVGGCGSFDGRVLFALLLDAARLDHAWRGRSPGGVLAVFEFGPLNQWMNGYWGGAVSAAAGCLVFGALPRLQERWLTRDAMLLGLGLAVQLLTRPYESILLVACALSISAGTAQAGGSAQTCASRGGRSARRPACDRDHARPEQAGHRLVDHSSLHAQPLSIRRARPRSLSSRIPCRTASSPAAATRIQDAGFISRWRAETIARYLVRLEYRVRFYRFFFFVPLYWRSGLRCGAARVAIRLGGSDPSDFRARRQFLSGILFPALHRRRYLPVDLGERDGARTAEPVDASADGRRAGRRHC